MSKKLLTQRNKKVQKNRQITLAIFISYKDFENERLPSCGWQASINPHSQ
jgi:hypothetical protein